MSLLSRKHKSSWHTNFLFLIPLGVEKLSLSSSTYEATKNNWWVLTFYKRNKAINPFHSSSFLLYLVKHQKTSGFLIFPVGKEIGIGTNGMKWVTWQSLVLNEGLTIWLPFAHVYTSKWLVWRCGTLLKHGLCKNYSRPAHPRLRKPS